MTEEMDYEVGYAIARCENPVCVNFHEDLEIQDIPQPIVPVVIGSVFIKCGPCGLQITNYTMLEGYDPDA